MTRSSAHRGTRPVESWGSGEEGTWSAGPKPLQDEQRKEQQVSEGSTGTFEQSGALKDRDMRERAPDRVPGLSKGWGSRGLG